MAPSVANTVANSTALASAASRALAASTASSGSVAIIPRRRTLGGRLLVPELDVGEQVPRRAAVAAARGAVGVALVRVHAELSPTAGLPLAARGVGGGVHVFRRWRQSFIETAGSSTAVISSPKLSSHVAASSPPSSALAHPDAGAPVSGGAAA
eukprot:CAMPEP_0176189458 /NCGR_PEP_ID=MMETSP0121_2-20121125/3440_1 /TAXON_ID=160619 /ORGANISM="Kryptoperidinium foliaceum, Strain CCMP 1326" /LENGTH=153 /DNA_ID=CAMNT_0017528063 /DNA_START=147 /DNA_END=607 /DNA_ORIENTATION=-